MLLYNFHICISTAADTLLTPQMTVLLQSCVTKANCSWASRAKEMFMFLHSKQAPAWTSSSPHLQHDCRPHHLPWGEKGQNPSQTHCPSSKGWQSRDTGWYTSWSSLCSWGRLSPTHLMPGKPWVPLSQPSSQHGGGLKAISPTSFCFKIILLPSFQQHV